MDTLSETQKTVLRQLAEAGERGLLYSALPTGCGRSLAVLVQEGLVARQDNGHWALTVAGREAAAALA
mgnify:CR=1 FL=1